MGQPIRDAIALLEKKVHGLFQMSMNTLECLILEPCFILKRNVSTPISKHGTSAAIDMLLPHNKTIVIVRNEAKF